jgi:hypothetical protein
MKPHAGLFGAMDVDTVITLDACTGETAEYIPAESPDWIDIVYYGNLICQKYDWHGMLRGGYLNSAFSQTNCVVTTDDFGYIVIEDDVWYFTGVTSVNSDRSNIGFIVSNARTGEYKYYSVVGAEEYSAMSAAEGEVQHMNYKASFPALINVSGEATYIMVLKDANGYVKQYGLVNVSHVGIVAIGNTQSEAMAAYKKLLVENGIISGEIVSDKKTDVTVNEIEKLVIDGNSWFYFLCSDGNYYRVSVAENPSALFIRESDAITVTYTETDLEGMRNIVEWTKTVPTAPETQE